MHEAESKGNMFNNYVSLGFDEIPETSKKILRDLMPSLLLVDSSLSMRRVVGSNRIENFSSNPLFDEIGDTYLGCSLELASLIVKRLLEMDPVGLVSFGTICDDSVNIISDFRKEYSDEFYKAEIIYGFGSTKISTILQKSCELVSKGVGSHIMSSVIIIVDKLSSHLIPGSIEDNVHDDYYSSRYLSDENSANSDNKMVFNQVMVSEYREAVYRIPENIHLTVIELESTDMECLAWKWVLRNMGNRYINVCRDAKDAPKDVIISNIIDKLNFMQFFTPNKVHIFCGNLCSSTCLILPRLFHLNEEWQIAGNLLELKIIGFVKQIDLIFSPIEFQFVILNQSETKTEGDQDKPTFELLLFGSMKKSGLDAIVRVNSSRTFGVLKRIENNKRKSSMVVSTFPKDYKIPFYGKCCELMIDDESELAYESSLHSNASENIPKQNQGSSLIFSYSQEFMKLLK